MPEGKITSLPFDKRNIHTRDPPPTSPMPPLGKPVEFRGVEIMHFANGKLVHVEFVVEWMSMMVDAGVYVLAQAETA